MRIAAFLFVIVLAVCFMIFSLNNADERVNVNKEPFADGKFHNVALAEVVFWSLAAGVLLSAFLFLIGYIGQSYQLRTTRRRIRALENEVTLLRNRPIEESADLLKGLDMKTDQEQVSLDKDSSP